MASPATTPAADSSTEAWADPLDDMDVSAEQELFFKVRDTFSLMLKSKRTPDEVFAMCGLTVDDLRRFARLQPQAAELLHIYLIAKKAALGAAFFMPRSQVHAGREDGRHRFRAVQIVPAVPFFASRGRCPA